MGDSMDRLDKKIDREMKKLNASEKKISVIEWLSNGLSRIADKLDGVAVGVKDNIVEHIEEKRQEREFQEDCQDAFDDYLEMHDDERVGMCDIYGLSNGGWRVIIHTEHGPIIKTIESINTYEQIDLDKIAQDFYFENKRGYKIGYEGYCSYASGEGVVSGIQKGNRWYYASVVCELLPKSNLLGMPVAMYRGIERKNNGKFRKVNMVQGDTEQLPEIYLDLKKEFAKQWASMRSKNNEGNNYGVIQGRFGRNNLFTLDR